jgi:hypothetical protein
LWKLAGILETSLDLLLTGSRDRLGIDMREIAYELRHLGVGDLAADNLPAAVAFRPAEQVLTLAIAGDEPDSRIVEALPAVLAWNTWSARLLRAYARNYDRRAPSRIAWLADIALTLDKTSGFPGGILQRKQLSQLLRTTKPSRTPDSLGRPAGDAVLPPVWKRWNVTYAASLADFRDRAEQLHARRQERCQEGRRLRAPSPGVEPSPLFPKLTQGNPV